MTHNLTVVSHAIDSADRRAQYGHAGAVIWLTGLSGSGKSTLAMALEKARITRGYACYVLNGDNREAWRCKKFCVTYSLISSSRSKILPSGLVTTIFPFLMLYVSRPFL